MILKKNTLRKYIKIRGDLYVSEIKKHFRGKSHDFGNRYFAGAYAGSAGGDCAGNDRGRHAGR